MSKDINTNFNLQNMMLTVADNHPAAFSVVMKMANTNAGVKNLYICNMLGIKGEKLYKLFCECCNKNMDLLNKTIILFIEGTFDMDKVKANLELEESIPFIDVTIPLDENEENQIFGVEHKNWDTYRDEQSKSFDSRIKKYLKTRA